MASKSKTEEMVVRDRKGALLRAGDVVFTGERRRTYHTVVALHPEKGEVDLRPYQIGDGLDMKEK